MAGLPKNNLAEQLTRFKANRSSLTGSSTPSSADRKSCFSFQKIVKGQSATSASSAQIRPGAFAPPFKQSHSTLTRSHSDVALSRPAAKPLSTHHPSGGKQGKITSIFGPQMSAVLVGASTTQRTSPPIAFVAPVGSQRETVTGTSNIDPTWCSTKDVQKHTSHPAWCNTEGVQEHASHTTWRSTEDVQKHTSHPAWCNTEGVQEHASHTTWCSTEDVQKHTSVQTSQRTESVMLQSPTTDLKLLLPSPTVVRQPPGATLAGSAVLSPSSVPPVIPPNSSATTMISKVGAEQKLEELRLERLRVMDEVCELLSDIPPSKITSLFGLSAAHVQKKLAVRKQLLSKEQEIKKKLETPQDTSLLSTLLPTPSCSATTATTHHQPSPLSFLPTDPSSPLSLPPTVPSTHHPSPLSLPPTATDFSTEEYDDWHMSDEDIFEDCSDDDDFTIPVGGGYSSAAATHSPLTATLNSSPPTCSSSTTPGSTLRTINVPMYPHTSLPPPLPPPPTATRPKPLSNPTLGMMDNAAEFHGPYPHTQEMFKIFTQVFGLQQFRPNQLQAVNAAILGKDCFVLMPTGGGKSLCYQLPSLMMPGVTVVVSPLRSLIQDQVQKLCSLEIPASHLSSDITASEECRVYTSLSLRDPTTRLLYVTPEKLGASNKLKSTLQGLYARDRLARFVIDEAHCISQWGHDFRPDYKRLSELRQHFPGVPIMALTATATPRVRTDILHQLHMNTVKWFTQSFNRTNLQYTVVPKKPKKVNEDIIEVIRGTFSGQSGIVYCLSRRDCDVVADDLNKAGIAALSYHAGLGDDERVMAQQRWIQEEQCKVVCATIAFGMGIDKPDVRFVIHHSLPKSVEGYYQESGRAGRDGRPASCILFYNYSDMTRMRRMIRKEKLRPAQERVHMDNLYRMVQYSENETDCRRVQLLEYFAEQFDPAQCQGGMTPCDNCQSKVPFHPEDVTELVRVVVESVQRMRKDQYTLIQCAEALRGSSSNRMLQSDLSRLPLYGKGTHMCRHDLERLLHMLVMRDILAENMVIGNHDNIIPYVKTGCKAGDMLSGRLGRIVLKIRGKGAISASSKLKSFRKNESKEDKVKAECYSALMKLRLTVAMKYRMKNPENVFSTETLCEMSRTLPTTRDQMLGVVGITEAKWKNMGVEQFLEVTKEYATKLATSVGSSKEQSPYWTGEPQKENRAPSLGRGKRRKSSLVGPKSKKPALVNEVDYFEPNSQPPPRRPGFLPPPRPMRTSKS